jgi:hypothetical protein
METTREANTRKCNDHTVKRTQSIARKATDAEKYKNATEKK